YMRRHLPELLIGWARVLEGRPRDPRVGRDLLIGGMLGACMAFSIHFANAAPAWINLPGQTTVFPNYDALAGGRLLLSYLIRAPIDTVGPALFFFGLYLILRLLTRKPWVAAVILGAVTTLVGLGGENAW